MIIRNATMNDLKIIHNLESECFPPNEAADKKEIKKRLEHYPNHFWLLIEENTLISFADGFTTNQKDLTDEMYENASMHDEKGDWQMIFGVNTKPEYRKKGYAKKLLREVIKISKKENRKGIVLTCKKELIPFYAKLGFNDEGITEKSHHGGVIWHQMRLTF